jgi:CHAD domain-containing protein
MSGDRVVSRRWSRALWAHPIQADSLYYRLRHDPDRCACALFDRAARAMSVQGQGPVSAAGHRESLIAALDCYKFGLIPESPASSQARLHRLRLDAKQVLQRLRDVMETFGPGGAG